MRLLIVEDDQLLLQNLAFLLGAEKGVELTGAVTTAEEALLRLKEEPPDMILLDMELPGMHGIDFIRKAKSLQPEVEILVHTVYEDRKTVFSAIKAGASGYVIKGITPRELLEALHEQYSGGVPMSPKIARAVIREFQSNASEEDFLLTHREIEILKYIRDGFTYKDISRRCGISRNTVHTHIKKIYQKLHAKNRKDALIKARRKGII